jgi:hypothetical protein
VTGPALPGLGDTWAATSVVSAGGDGLSGVPDDGQRAAAQPAAAWTDAAAVPLTTGHEDVDAALAALADVVDAPPAEQVGPLDEALEVLRTTLDSIGQAEPVR